MHKNLPLNLRIFTKLFLPTKPTHLRRGGFHIRPSSPRSHIYKKDPSSEEDGSFRYCISPKAVRWECRAGWEP